MPQALLDSSSIHRYETVRTLKVVDVGVLANRTTNNKLRDLVQARGQGAEGYKLTRDLSRMCMQEDEKIDGLLYLSAVYSVSGSMVSCNLVLFDKRETQVKPIDYKPVAGVVFSDGETTEEFLESLGVVLV